MTRHARLQLDMWRKGGHEDTSPLARHMYTTLLLDETMTRCGVARIPADGWAADSGMTPEDAHRALEELVKRRFVLIDGMELLVRTYIRNDKVYTQPNVLRSALRSALLVRSTLLRRALAVELWKLDPPLPPRMTARGRMFHYPDPHACAAELAPDYTPPDGAAMKASVNPSLNPSLNPSGPDESGAREPFSEPFIEGFGEPLGVGVGVGDVVPRLSDLHNSASGRPAPAHAPAHTREAEPAPPPAPTPPTTAHGAALSWSSARTNRTRRTSPNAPRSSAPPAPVSARRAPPPGSPPRLPSPRPRCCSPTS